MQRRTYALYVYFERRRICSRSFCSRSFRHTLREWGIRCRGQTVGPAESESAGKIARPTNRAFSSSFAGGTPIPTDSEFPAKCAGNSCKSHECPVKSLASLRPLAGPARPETGQVPVSGFHDQPRLRRCRILHEVLWPLHFDVGAGLVGGNQADDGRGTGHAGLEEDDAGERALSSRFEGVTRFQHFAPSVTGD